MRVFCAHVAAPSGKVGEFREGRTFYYFVVATSVNTLIGGDGKALYFGKHCKEPQLPNAMTEKGVSLLTRRENTMFPSCLLLYTLSSDVPLSLMANSPVIRPPLTAQRNQLQIRISQQPFCSNKA